MHQTVHPHDLDELCAPGAELYARALQEGRIRTAVAEAAPCLVDGALLQPDVRDTDWLLPTPPSVALPRLLRGIEDGIAAQRRRESRLTEQFAPLLQLHSSQQADQDTAAITVLEGIPRVRSALAHAVRACAEEALSLQPGSEVPAEIARSRPYEQDILSRGGTIRTLYEHSHRHLPLVLDHFASLTGDVQVRTLDEVSEQLLVFDRAVAFLPANSARTVALEIRHPALIDYLVLSFERLWRLATPMHPVIAPLPATDGVTDRQRAIAALLVEGETDDRIAERLGLNVRTCRTHIAHLATILGSSNRAQLGYLIGRSGILDGPA
ncbi:helix-turn-helix transcriptional regulator [Streptomyces physcomitrii]|uniref:Helix-turn-helix transcriptional regulator n=1 Tax=Streptomyces physcomitrii TaxID=2724184 RepID=A0ABX1H057_9ACTN|nr:LuxR C-terminal-related transcriptional regulator [Streptomyces physcomitrii]NKI41741.1 helix-turn-helix transcriptional regulator [Streptomyces physcomitrii]